MLCSSYISRKQNLIHSSTAHCTGSISVHHRHNSSVRILHLSVSFVRDILLFHCNIFSLLCAFLSRFYHFFITLSMHMNVYTRFSQTIPSIILIVLMDNVAVSFLFLCMFIWMMMWTVTFRLSRLFHVPSLPCHPLIYRLTTYMIAPLMLLLLLFYLNI